MSSYCSRTGRYRDRENTAGKRVKLAGLAEKATGLTGHEEEGSTRRNSRTWQSREER